jgi:hypothetical protein
MSVFVPTVFFALPFLSSARRYLSVARISLDCCIKGEEYNEIASLIFPDLGAASRQIFHMRMHPFK